MRVSRDKIIQTMLAHKPAFYALVDYVQHQGGSAEIPQKLYIDAYHQHIVASGDDYAIRVLSLDALSKNGIIVHLDHQAGTLTLQSFVMELLRFLDTSRVRELSQQDFEQMRDQFQRLAQVMEAMPTLQGLPDYDETKITLFELIDQTLSKIQQNVEGLSAQVNRLGVRYEALDKAVEGQTESLRLLDDATRLYERFIRPCNAFLSPKIDSAGDQISFTQSMTRLYELHEKRGESYTGFRIRYKLTAIRSYYKDIALMQQRVRRYTQTLASERKRYNAIEKAYKALEDAVVELRHGKLRGTKLSSYHDIFRSTHSLSGLKKRQVIQDAKLNWYEVDQQARLNEWLATVDLQQDIVPDLKPLVIPVDVDEQRRAELMRLCIERQWPESSDDLIEDVHNWLYESIDDHKLLDTLIAYQSLTTLPGLSRRLKPQKQRVAINDGEYEFKYVRLSLIPDAMNKTSKMPIKKGA